MTIVLKNKETLVFDEFTFRCCIGKKGTAKRKIEGDKKTPVGTFSLGNLYYRRDRHIKPLTKLSLITILPSNKLLFSYIGEMLLTCLRLYLDSL